MTTFICSICGYIHEGDEAPRRCPVCKSPSSLFLSSEDDGQNDQHELVNGSNVKVDNESQTIAQSQFNGQDVTIVENTTNEIDPIITVEEKIIKIAEAEGINKAVKWYKDNSNSDTDEAIETVKAICSQKRVYCSLDDEKEILKFGEARLQTIKWYKDKHRCELKEAVDVVDSVLVKHGKRSATNNDYSIKNGCIITMIIVLTSTISMICLI